MKTSGKTIDVCLNLADLQVPYVCKIFHESLTAISYGTRFKLLRKPKKKQTNENKKYCSHHYSGNSMHTRNERKFIHPYWTKYSPSQHHDSHSFFQDHFLCRETVNRAFYAKLIPSRHEWKTALKIRKPAQDLISFPFRTLLWSQLKGLARPRRSLALAFPYTWLTRVGSSWQRWKSFLFLFPSLSARILALSSKASRSVYFG